RREHGRRARSDGHQRRRPRPPACAALARSGAARGRAARGARGHELRGSEPLARHSDRHRDVAAVEGPGEAAQAHERRSLAQRAAGGPMTEEEDRIEYAAQNAALHRKFDAVLTEPIPASMYMKRPAWLEYAQAASLLAVGVAIGLAIPMF